MSDIKFIDDDGKSYINEECYDNSVIFMMINEPRARIEATGIIIKGINDEA